MEVKFEIISSPSEKDFFFKSQKKQDINLPNNVSSTFVILYPKSI